MTERPVDTSAVDPRESRLEQLRREAELGGRVERPGIRLSGAPFPQRPRASAETGYYGVPLLKVPVWTWEVPIYFFTGGIAGAAAIIASVARITVADQDLVRDARMLAAIGGGISPMLLIADLGMPSRFLHMLRVFKIQSPMSIGSWTLVVFSSSAAGLALLDLLGRRNRRLQILRAAANVAEFLSVTSGAVLSTYTGVLVGATAVPAWNRNVKMLPFHFGASGVGSAVSILELRGHKAPALNGIGMASALTETMVGASLEIRRDRALEPLRTGTSGWLTRTGGILSGPVPLALRLLSVAASGRRRRMLRRAAAVSTLAGSLITRFAWIEAGKTSARDPRIPLELEYQSNVKK